MSANIQPQTFLGTLWQIPTVVNSVRTSCNSTRIGTCRKEVSLSSKQPEISESTLAALRELGLESWIDTVDLTTLLPVLHQHSHSSSCSDQNYVSANTFFQNKHGFSENAVLSWASTKVSRFSPMHIQTRGLFSLKREADTRDWGTHISKSSEASPLANAESNARLKVFSTDVLEKDGLQKDLTVAYNLGSKIADKGVQRDSGKTSFLLRPFSKTEDAAKHLAANNPKRFRLLVQKYQNSPELVKKLHVAFSQGFNESVLEEGSASRFRSSFRKGFVLCTFAFMSAVVFYSLFLSNNLLGGLFKQTPFPALEEKTNVSFEDVKGVDEAKEELQDIVKYLKDPGKFNDIGAKLPKGVLLVGPPGTGKTLLARAVAGEADVPFFSAAGSEFEEIFVGTGAKKVRQLFRNAQMFAPCVIFLDEIDAVGGKRTTSYLHPYANQTINQLLSEMDGFHKNEGVIVIGATNRREHLDSALLRPGRFDVQVHVYPPDLKGRQDMLKLYLSKVKLGDDLDLERLGKMTTGFTGADIENVVNQAALKTAMDGDPGVSMRHLEFAIDKCMMGPAKKGKIMHKAANVRTAVHEAGHTLVAHHTKYAMPINKVTILPRGNSLGHTSFLPPEDHENVCRGQLLAQLDVAMGGRVAEELVFGLDHTSTGASHDFETATTIATAMVRNMGMSEKVGMRVFSDDPLNSPAISPAIAEEIDNEIKRLLQESYERAKSILKIHNGELLVLSEKLYKEETLTSEQVKVFLKQNKNISRARFKDLEEILALQRKQEQ